MPFSTVLQLCCGGKGTYPCFPVVLIISTPHNILSMPLAAFSHVETMDSCERGMIPVAMTIINPPKE